MTVGALYDELLGTLSASLSVLPDKPEETPESCLRALWLKASGKAVSAASAMNASLGHLDGNEEQVLRGLISARLGGKPLAHLTGRQQFMGVDFISTPQALIPRKETELLARFMVELIRGSSTPLKEQVVVDVFTGSGNIPLSLAKLLPGPRYYGGDLSSEAIALGKKNAEFLQLEEQCTFFCGDLLSPFPAEKFSGRVDIISGAPPYISSGKLPSMPGETARNEPSLAFDAGPFGVTFFMRLIKESPPLLKAGGWLCFEVGLGQGLAMAQRLQRNPLYANVKPIVDGNGEIRVVAAQAKG